ncbi:MAG: hypothetical protein P8J27_03575 [Mariniblastus sp.]|nr:hypothetical protein [Mariniblastus sp.]
MKWLAFGAFLMVGVPFMAAMATSSRKARVLLFAALVASTVLKISVNFYSIEDYRGPDRGFEISMTDLIATGLGLGLIISQWKQICWLPFNLLLYLGMVCMAIFSLANAPDFQLAGFTIFKWAKTTILYWTVFNCVWCDWPIRGMVAGIIGAAGIETLIGFQQKYLIGMYRINGTFDHSNAIPAYLLMIIPILMSWMFARSRTTFENLASVIAILGMCFVVAATMSRAGLLLMGMTITGSLTYAIVKSPTPPKIGIAFLFMAIFLAGGIKSMDSFIERFENAPESSGQARDEFNDAADLMAEKNILGVGVNCFSRVMTEDARYRESIHVMEAEEHAGVCHHIYRLTAAEIGYAGLGVFLMIVGRFLFTMAPFAFGAYGEEGCILFGVAAGSLALHAVGLFEWVFRVTPVWNLFWITSGFGAATAMRLKRGRQGEFEFP